MAFQFISKIHWACAEQAQRYPISPYSLVTSLITCTTSINRGWVGLVYRLKQDEMLNSKKSQQVNIVLDKAKRAAISFEKCIPGATENKVSVLYISNKTWLKYRPLLAVLSFVFALFVVTVGFLTTLTLPPISAAASMVLLIRVSCDKIFR